MDMNKMSRPPRKRGIFYRSLCRFAPSSLCSSASASCLKVTPATQVLHLLWPPDEREPSEASGERSLIAIKVEPGGESSECLYARIEDSLNELSPLRRQLIFDEKGLVLERVWISPHGALDGQIRRAANLPRLRHSWNLSLRLSFNADRSSACGQK